jgi:TM2 domain-containing membrane protein YozV
MYCGKCGNQLEAGDSFCGKCGQNVGNVAGGPAAPTVVVREKSEGAAAALSLLWSGLGQVYVGRIARGLGIMLAGFLLAFLGLFFIVGGAVVGGAAGLGVGAIIYMVLLLAFWVWNVFDAYKLAKEYNDHLRATGNRPW